MSNQPESSLLPPPPGFARLGTLVASVLLGLSALPLIFLSIGAFGGFAWALCGFELVVLGAAVVGVLAGTGRFRDGYALALTCLAGTVFIAAVLGIHSYMRTLASGNATYQPWVDRVLFFRIAIAVGYAAMGSLAVFSRNTRCWGAFFRAAGFLVPAAIIGAALAKFGFPFKPAATSTEPEAAHVIGILIIGLLLMILVSGGGHFLIRAYELGRPKKDPADPAATPPAGAKAGS